MQLQECRLPLLCLYCWNFRIRNVNRKSWDDIASKGVFRSILGFLRAIHELIWALIFVAMFGLSPLSAILALGIPYGGILGRIFADMLNDVPEEPIKALSSRCIEASMPTLWIFPFCKGRYDQLYHVSF